MEIKRSQFSGDEEFIAKVYECKVENNMTNKECNQYINLELNSDYAESTTRGVAKYYSLGFSNGFEKALSESKGENNLLKELEEKKIEIEKEKIRFQDQKREYKNYLRADARFEHLRDTMIKEIRLLNESKPLNNFYKGEITGDREASLILSDLHIGLETDNYWNKFNKKIALERLNRLKIKVIENCKRHNVIKLHIELLGDFINGYIHLGNRVSNEEDVISQSMTCAEMISDFVNDLSIEIPYICIYGATGNHGRCTPNLKDSISIENFERLIPWFMKERIKSKNIEFLENCVDDNIILYNVLNETIFAVHGHEDKIGTVISDLSKMLKIFPTQIHMGHYHRHSTIEDNDMELIINSSFSGTDDYAKSIRKTNKPSQTLIIYNELGEECIYKIKLER